MIASEWVEKQQIPSIIVFALTRSMRWWWASHPQSAALKVSMLTITPPMWLTWMCYKCVLNCSNNLQYTCMTYELLSIHLVSSYKLHITYLCFFQCIDIRKFRIRYDFVKISTCKYQCKVTSIKLDLNKTLELTKTGDGSVT